MVGAQDDFVGRKNLRCESDACLKAYMGRSFVVIDAIQIDVRLGIVYVLVL